jgi:hypothetical protein
MIMSSLIQRSRDEQKALLEQASSPTETRKEPKSELKPVDKKAVEDKV